MARKKVLSTNTYVIDIESGTETARLIDQDRLITQVIGLLPERSWHLFPDREQCAYSILDLACGPGAWALEAAHRFPEMEVIGVDLSRTMVEYAQARARVMRLQNARFEEMDVMQPLELPSAAFQVINARFLLGFLRPVAWKPLLLECKRLLAPRGVVCLTEMEWPQSTSVAYTKLGELTMRALWLAQQSLSPDGRSFGVLPRLGRFLRECGFERVRVRSCPLDWSADTELHRPFANNALVAVLLLRDFLLRMQVTTAEEFDELARQMQAEFDDVSFCGLATPLCVWGRA